MRPGRNAWCLISGRNDISCLLNISLTRRHIVEISGRGPKFVVIYMRPVRRPTETNSDRSQTKSDRSEFIVRPDRHVNAIEEMYEGRYELMPV